MHRRWSAGRLCGARRRARTSINACGAQHFLLGRASRSRRAAAALAKRAGPSAAAAAAAAAAATRVTARQALGEPLAQPNYEMAAGQSAAAAAAAAAVAAAAAPSARPRIATVCRHQPARRPSSCKSAAPAALAPAATNGKRAARSSFKLTDRSFARTCVSACVCDAPRRGTHLTEQRRRI